MPTLASATLNVINIKVKVLLNLKDNTAKLIPMNNINIKISIIISKTITWNQADLKIILWAKNPTIISIHNIE